MTSMLGAALRRKFKRPQDVLIALGLDPALLAADAALEKDTEPMTASIQMKPAARDKLRRRLSSDRSRRAFDEMTDEDVDALVAAYLNGGDGGGAYDQEPSQPRKRTNMSREQIQEVMDFLSTRMSDDDLRQAAELILRDNATPAEDEPLPFSGRPRPGGEMDQISRDAKVLAVDAKMRTESTARQSFKRMYPRATVAGVLPCETGHQRPARIDPAAEASFDRLFPRSRRIRSL